MCQRPDVRREGAAPAYPPDREAVRPSLAAGVAFG